MSPCTLYLYLRDLIASHGEYVKLTHGGNQRARNEESHEASLQPPQSRKAGGGAAAVGTPSASMLKMARALMLILGQCLIWGEDREAGFAVVAARARLIFVMFNRCM
jgi:hypothetical protein